MKRPAFLLLIVALLSSCSFGAHITADEALNRVYASAAYDAEHTDIDHVTDARKRHQADLEREIYRLCGTLQDGSKPPKCNLAPIDAAPDKDRDSAQVLRDAMDAIESEINNAPKESLIVLARQYAELATLALKAPELPKDPSLGTPHDVDRLRAGIEHEYANAYGLEVASARDNAGTEARLDELVEAHRKYAQDLSKIITDGAPAPAPGYTIDDPVTDPTAFAANLERDSVAFWLAETTAAETDDWRIICLRSAAAAALRATLLDPNTDYLRNPDTSTEN
ncbi:DUF4439 domain-containing protein [Corynebacterium sp.]|uniref:DUF4439 domain-containing protein n=1 Tax=Corynebacterium sp. TaxID=1720 RepID=UPI0026DB5C68|nr:DUF4439 domain-containing protein [Corynebacterium sp.]MDO5075766.1 DUF4439 domain-containing protein [Corynebacterium sp.]